MKIVEIIEAIDLNLLKAFQGISPNSPDASASVAGTGNTPPNSSSDSKIVVIGDSLAVGTGSSVPGAIVDAKVGIDSSAILSNAQNNKQLQNADVAIISAGANDGAGASGKNPNSQKTIANLEAIRSSLNAKKYVWILPYNRSVAQDIMSVVKPGDEVVDLAKTTTPSKDGIHPSSYAPVAKDAIGKGGVKPQAPATKPSKPMPVGNNLTNDENSQRAQDASEKFLGRKIESDEWNYLIRAIYGEATSNQKEIAYVAAVMLNRTRSGKWGRSIISVLTAKNQFQAVTGTNADGHSASRHFKQGPGKGSLSNIYKALIDILPHAPTNIMRFTAANRKAYGAGTDVRYLDQLIAQGGQQIGGTVFA